MKYIFITFLFPVFIFASNAQYCLRGELSDINGKKLSKMTCDVAQSLRWEDSSAVFVCDFDGEKSHHLEPSVTIGSDLNSTGYTKYVLSKRNNLGKYLLNGLRVPGELNFAQDIVVYYTDTVKSVPYVHIDTNTGLYKLDLSVEFKTCD